jgi:beta-lactamase class A
VEQIMTNRLRNIGAAGAGLTLILTLGPSSAQAATPLEDELRRQAEAAGGTVGVAAIHIESGQRASLRGSQRFTMMSCYKFPIGLTLLHRVERGEVSLEKSVPIGQSDLRLGRSPLAARYPDGGVTRTVGELMEAMIVESDNTASDLVLREAGGAAAVTSRLRELGISEIRVDRPEAWLGLDHAGR